MHFHVADMMFSTSASLVPLHGMYVICNVTKTNVIIEHKLEKIQSLMK